jgi:hypothetical protein
MATIFVKVKFRQLLFGRSPTLGDLKWLPFIGISLNIVPGGTMRFRHWGMRGTTLSRPCGSGAGASTGAQRWLRSTIAC